MLVMRPILELGRAVPGLVALLVVGNSSGRGALWGLVGAAVAVAVGILRWITTTYRIGPDQVQLRQGLLRRRLLTVPRDRVRTVDVTAHALHRVFGLARVSVGSGRSDEHGGGSVKLDALSAVEASLLRDELLGHRTRSQVSGPAEAVTVEVELVRLDLGWVRYGPFTLSGAITVGVLAAFAWRVASAAHLDQALLGPARDEAARLARASLWLVAIGAAVACLAVVAAASTIGYVLAFWGFRLTRQAEGTLQVTRGLVTTRATTIEERRLRGVELSEPLLLRAVGGARCIAITTGLRVGRGAERGGSLLLPPAPRRAALRVAAVVLRAEAPVKLPLLVHGRRALRRRFTRALGVSALIVAALLTLWWLAGWPSWAWEASLLLLPGAAILAADRYRNLGHAVVEGRLVSGRGSLVRRRSVLDDDGIIGWNLRGSLLQRRAGLVTLAATTAAGHQHYGIQDVALCEALRVADGLVPDLLTPFLVRQDPERAAGAVGLRAGASWRQGQDLP
ncbi:MAG: PH domain-containing protein [Candidatus Dormibacteraeota bacterium]|nr:PH domain-containing protein [Candidatus Dormibacteraeota bacterium]